MTALARVTGFGLALPEGWTQIPADLTDPDDWAFRTAGEILAEASAPATVTMPAELSTDGSTATGETIDLRSLLAGQIGDVAAAAAATGLGGRLHAAFLVREPELGLVDAMLTVMSHADVSPEGYAAEIDEAVRESERNDYLFAQAVEGSVASGEVRGAHLMIGHVDPQGPEGTAQLEERVTLGVFPTGSPDMIEVTAIASAIDAFDDLTATIFETLEGLTVDLEGVA